MSNVFIILKMEKYPEHKLIQMECLIGNERRKYELQFKGLGVDIPGELENTITQTIERSKQFIEIVFAFQEGVNIEFPVDLSNV